MSAWRASAGPFTTQPITATVIGTLSLAMYASTALTVGTMSYSRRPHVGHAISVGLSLRKARVLRISWATRTSSRGSDVASETRIVSPIPSLNKIPSPTELRMLPASTGPDSVTPRWIGYARAAANLRLAMMLVQTSVDFSDTLMKPGP